MLSHLCSGPPELARRIAPLCLATLMLAGVLGPASAQQRFPRSCCGEYDCLLKPIPRYEVQRRDNGWLVLKEQRLVPFNQVRPSPDAGVYICRTEMGHGTLIHPPGEPPCLFMPESEG